MAAFDAIFGVGSATATPLFRETSAFRRKDDQYAARGPSDQDPAKQKAPPSAPAPAAKPTRKRKAQQDIADTRDGAAKPAQVGGERRGRAAKKPAAVLAQRGQEAQESRKKPKPLAATAAPSKQRALPALHQKQARQKVMPVRATASSGGEVSEQAVIEATGSDEPPLQLEDAAAQQPALPPRPVS